MISQGSNLQTKILTVSVTFSVLLVSQCSTMDLTAKTVNRPCAKAAHNNVLGHKPTNKTGRSNLKTPQPVEPAKPSYVDQSSDVVRGNFDKVDQD